ncbi:hypothetical protein ACTMU2_08505 [Cupriavidus basilensis]
MDTRGRLRTALAAGCGTLSSEPAPEGFYRVESGVLPCISIARKNRRNVRDLVPAGTTLPSADRIEPAGQLIRVKPPGRRHCHGIVIGVLRRKL